VAELVYHLYWFSIIRLGGTSNHFLPATLFVRGLEQTLASSYTGGKQEFPQDGFKQISVIHDQVSSISDFMIANPLQLPANISLEFNWH